MNEPVSNPYTLPADVSRCQPAGLCLRRMRCARFTDPGGDWTPVTAFDPVGCEAFIPDQSGQDDAHNGHEGASDG